MKIASFTIDVDHARIEHDTEAEERWGLIPVCFSLSGDALPVEGVATEVVEDGDRLHITMLMSDDHAERMAVSPNTRDVQWEA